MERSNEKSAFSESLRRLGGILASPSLAMSYEHTTPLIERAYMRRLGLTKDEAARLLEKICEHGLLDGGVRALLGGICARRHISETEAARMLLADEGWPDREEE